MKEIQEYIQLKKQEIYKKYNWSRKINITDEKAKQSIAMDFKDIINSVIPYFEIFGLNIENPDEEILELELSVSYGESQVREYLNMVLSQFVLSKRKTHVPSPKEYIEILLRFFMEKKEIKHLTFNSLLYWIKWSFSELEDAIEQLEDASENIIVEGDVILNNVPYDLTSFKNFINDLADELKDMKSDNQEKQREINELKVQIAAINKEITESKNPGGVLKDNRHKIWDIIRKAKKIDLIKCITHVTLAALEYKTN